MSAFRDRHLTPEVLAHECQDLKRKIREAIAWGAPCQESLGMSHSELITLLHKALKEIERLEKPRR